MNILLSNILYSGQIRSQIISVDILDAIRQNDIVGMACIIICALFSIVSWAIILYKFLQLSTVSRQSGLFLDNCMSESVTLDEIYKVAADYPDCPLSQILRESYVEAEVENWYRDYREMPLQDKLTLAKVGLERVMEQTISHEMRKLEGGLNFLATTASVSPFFGLFGTVWGILACFQSVATQGSVGLSALAPGVSTALMTTVVGLVAAIPASISYNYFTSRVQALLSQMDSFSMELSNIIQKQVIKQARFELAQA